MATLTNPINATNIVNRFADFVLAEANSSIVWGTDARPFPEFILYDGGGTNDPLGGTTDGTSLRAGTVNDAAALVTNKETITALTIVNLLLLETTSYTHIRNLNARKKTTRTGFTDNTTITTDYGTAKANVRTTFTQTILTADVDKAGVVSGEAADDAKLETFFGNLRSAYIGKKNNTTVLSRTICHSSCHSSCHTSRWRR